MKPIDGIPHGPRGFIAESIALVAFGLDSATSERRAQRWVAISFFLLAPYVAAEAIETLIDGAAAETSWLGIALTAGTLLLCPWLGLTKQRIAEKLGSRATYGEGRRTCCAPSWPGLC